MQRAARHLADPYGREHHVLEQGHRSTSHLHHRQLQVRRQQEHGQRRARSSRQAQSAVPRGTGRAAVRRALTTVRPLRGVASLRQRAVCQHRASVLGDAVEERRAQTVPGCDVCIASHGRLRLSARASMRSGTTRSSARGASACRAAVRRDQDSVSTRDEREASSVVRREPRSRASSKGCCCLLFVFCVHLFGHLCKIAQAASHEP